MVRDYATEYAKAVVSGKKELACQAEILACKRHLDDLKRKDLVFRADIAEKHIRFAEKLHIYIKNEKRYVPLKLRGFQKFILCSIFGWYTSTGIRRFNEMYCQLARKNGKSFLNSFLCLDFSTLSAIKDGQIYTAGTNYANASIVWNDTVKLIEADSKLSEYFAIKDYGDSRSKIINKRNGTKIIPLSGTSDKDGFLPYLACIDEYHLHQDDSMYNVLLDGQVGLHNSLLAVITTAGNNLNGPCYKQYKYCKQVLTGAIKQDNLFVYINEIDLPDSHEFEEEYTEKLWNPLNWSQANPLLLYSDDYHITKDENAWRDFTSIAEKAKKEEGSTLSNFLIKKLNNWTTVGSSSFVNDLDWVACGTDNLPDLKGKRCFLGLDLSSKNDLSSLSAIFPVQEGINIPYLWSISFLPKNTLERHIRKDHFAYDKAEKYGYLKLTDCGGKNGFILDYEYIAQFVKNWIKENELKVALFGYDAMGIQGILASLMNDIDTEFVEIVQTAKSLNETCRYFQGLVAGRQIQYDKNNELLTYSIINAVATLNSKKEMLIDKNGGKIDAIDACLDATKCMLLTDGNNENQAEKDKKIVDEWLKIMDDW